MKKKRIIIGIILFISMAFVYGESTFTTSFTGTGEASEYLSGGLLPFTVSWTKNKSLQMLDEEEFEKAHLTLSFSSSLSNVQDWNGKYGIATGAIGGNDPFYGKKYFNPTASISMSLSQKFEFWTINGSFSTRYSHPMESLTLSNQDELKDKYYVFGNGYWDQESVAAYPWFYGERNNFTANMGVSFSRNYIVKGLDSMNVSLGFEMGPWWMLNSISNGNRLSDYYRISGSASQSVRLKNTEQSIQLRWISISASHSNSFSYTFGSIVPQHKIGSYRLRGSLSDTFSISVSGPQLYDSSTTISGSASLVNVLYFGSTENARDKIYRASYDSYISLWGNMTLFGIVSFSFSGTRYLTRGLSGGGNEWSVVGEVSMSFNL